MKTSHNKLPLVDCSRGAPMGRISYCHENIPPETPFKFHLSYVALDSGGYDSGGAYWGQRMPGQRLYWFRWKQHVTGFVDAPNRAAAKEEIVKEYPNATFYR